MVAGAEAEGQEAAREDVDSLAQLAVAEALAAGDDRRGQRMALGRLVQDLAERERGVGGHGLRLPSRSKSC